MRRLRAELQQRGSSDVAYQQAAGCDLNSAEAVAQVNEYLARITLEQTLARLTTTTLVWHMRRWKIEMPDDAACWTDRRDGGVLTARGVARVEQQLRQARRSRIVWWCVLVLSVGALTAGAATSLWSVAN